MDVAAEEGNEEGRKEGRQVTIITNEREIVMWPEFGAMQRGRDIEKDVKSVIESWHNDCQPK